MAALDPSVLDAKFADWLARVGQMHQGAHHRSNRVAAFAPLPAPLSRCRVALLSTAGVHVEGQSPFDVADPSGDPSFRELPDDVDFRRLRFAHSHYDTTAAEADPNVVLPLGPLHDLVAEGRVGSASPVHVGMMGFNPDPVRIVEESAPAIVALLQRVGAQVAVLAPG